MSRIDNMGENSKKLKKIFLIIKQTYHIAVMIKVLYYQFIIIPIIIILNK